MENKTAVRNHINGEETEPEQNNDQVRRKQLEVDRHSAADKRAELREIRKHENKARKYDKLADKEAKRGRERRRIFHERFG
jgi:membrane protein involved in colicin uptake